MLRFFETAPSHTYLRGGKESKRLQFHKAAQWEKQTSRNWDYNDYLTKNTMANKFNKKAQKARMRRKIRAAIRASNKSERRKSPYIRTKRVKSRLRRRPAKRILRQIKNEDIDVCQNTFEYLGQLSTTTNAQSVNTFMYAKYNNASWPLSSANYQMLQATQHVVGTSWNQDTLLMIPNGTDTYNQATPTGVLTNTTSTVRSSWELGTNFSWRDMLCYAEALFAPTANNPDLQGSANNGTLYPVIYNYPNNTVALRSAIQGYLPAQSIATPTTEPTGNPNILWPIMKNFFPQDGSGAYPTDINKFFYPNQLGWVDNVAGDNQNAYKLSILRKARLYVFNETLEFSFTNTSEADAKICIYECILKKEVPLAHGTSNPYYEVGALPDPKRLWQLYAEQNHHIDDNNIDYANPQINSSTSTWIKSVSSPGMTPMGPYLNDIYRVVPHVIYLQGGQTRNYSFKVDYNMGIKGLWMHSYYGIPNITRTFMITTCGVNAIGINKIEGLDTNGFSQRVTPPTNIAIKWTKNRRFTKIQEKEKHHLTLRAPIQTTFDAVVQFNEEDDDFQQVNTAQAEATNNNI